MAEHDSLVLFTDTRKGQEFGIFLEPPRTSTGLAPLYTLYRNSMVAEKDMSQRRRSDIAAIALRRRCDGSVVLQCTVD